MLGQVVGSILSTAKEKLIDHGFGIFLGKFNSKPGLEDVERSFKSLTARADDLERDISTQQQGGGKRKREEVTVWFREVKRARREYRAFQKKEKTKGFVKRMFGGDEAKQLSDRLHELVDRSRQFGELVGDDTTLGGVARPTTRLEGEAFEDNFNRIWNVLKNDQVSSIGVYGMGGVGKSTLVDHINNQLLKTNECVFWVVVSQECTIKALQDKIALKLDVELSGEDDVGTRAGRLHNALSQREKFILILDDIWEHIDLVKVGVPLPLPGCKWMMTSRSLKLCQELNCQEKIEVKPLSRDEGWNLFLKNLGQDATLALGDPEVERIAKRVVRICNGLPLGIITLAGAMSGVTDIQEWRHALRVLKESVMRYQYMEEKVFRVLKYSFDRLNPNDQRCFLYCSLYPEDFEIPREELLTKLIAEDLVDTTKSMEAQRDEGHSILTSLVKVSLLEGVSDKYIGECVKMHDLVRAMAHLITKGKTMVMAGGYFRTKEIPNEEEWTRDVERVSLMMNSIEEIPHGISPNSPKLSTLILQRNPLTKGIAASFFSRMCGLCTLDLSNTEIVELPNSVSDLVSLKSLLLKECYKLRQVPCLRKLKALRDVDLSSCRKLEDVPPGMEELINIRSLSMSGAEQLPEECLVLKSPRLQLLRVPSNIQVELAEDSWKRLEVFQGRLEDMTEFSRFAAGKQDRVTYSIAVGARCSYLPNECGFGTRRLFISGYNSKVDVEGNEFTALAEYIHHLKFNGCNGLQSCFFDNLSKTSSLKKFEFISCGGMEYMLSCEQLKAPPQQKSRFQALEEIKLHDLLDFKGVIHNWDIEAAVQPSVFPSLKKLSIERCNKMKKVGLPLSIFEKLEYISFQGCENVEEIIHVGEAHEDGLISLPKLTHLSLVDLPSLESFCDAPIICNSIQTLELKNCPTLEEPSLNLGTRVSYRPHYAGATSSTTNK